jgi:hypothetical protein
MAIRFRIVVLAALGVAALATPAAAFFYAKATQTLRAGPGGNAGASGTVGKGQRLSLLRCEADWCLIGAGKRTGWIESRFIGVAADPSPWPAPLPPPQGLPTWRWRHGPLDFPDPPLGPPRPPLAEPDLRLY